MHITVKNMWREFLSTLDQSERDSMPEFSAWHFCDNETDANECARLVLTGQKRATAPSLWELEATGDKIPEVGDLHVITDWDGVARCIIQTTGVQIVPFAQVAPEHAALEGEGDGSLQYWRKVHWDYYSRVLKGSGYEPSQDMPVVCEQFKVVFPNSSNAV